MKFINMDNMFEKAKNLSKNKRKTSAKKIYNKIINEITKADIDNIDDYLLKLLINCHFGILTIDYNFNGKIANDLVIYIYKYLERNPNDHDIRLGLAHLYEFKSQFNDSWQQIHYILKQDPENIEALESATSMSYLSDKFYSVNDYIEMHERLVRIQPKKLKYQYALANSYKYKKNYDKVREILNIILKNMDNDEFETSILRMGKEESRAFIIEKLNSIDEEMKRECDQK